jgi:glyoxylase-like metal-dependent hydrolase (beta-lactamase superfamily II)
MRGFEEEGIMTTSRMAWAICGLALTVAVLTASGEEPKIQVSELTEGLYLLSTDQGSYTTNTIASVGDDGVLLVDTQAETDAEALKQVVDGFGRGAPKIIINTHRHVEHVGGNAVFGEEAIVIAHYLVPTKLRSGSYLFDEFPRATYPDITFADTITLWFNGEEIRLIAFPGSHDDNEIIVHFTDSKVVHLSSLVNGFNFPSVDSDGDALMFAPLVERAVELLPKDVIIVSGHNRTGSVEDLSAYHKMLVATEEVVREGLAAGKDAEALKEEEVLDGWSSYADSYVSVDQWTDTLAAAIVPGDKKKPTLMEPLYYEWKANGAQAAADLYRQLKKDRVDDFDFRDIDLLIIGDKMLKKGHAESAVVFLELSLAEYPESNYAYYVNYDLAEAHKDLGDRKTALEHCRRAAEANPESDAISKLLAELEGGQGD